MYIGQDSRRPAGRTSSSLPPFVHENGYSLSVSDLGNAGVKLELRHDGEVGAAIILSPDDVHRFGKWLLRTLGQDKHGFPLELGGILKRLAKTKVDDSILHRGDKKHLKDALRALQS